MTPKPRSGISDPAVQQIFDDILAFMGSGNYTQVSTNTSASGTGTNQTMTCTGADGSSWNYGEFSPGIRVSITPTTTSLGPGETQQFTAAATNPDGSAVATPVFSWSFTSGGGLGAIDATGLYTAPAAIAAAGTDQIKCALNGSTAFATLLVNLHP